MAKKVSEALQEIIEDRYEGTKLKQSPADKVKHLLKVAIGMAITLFIIMSFIVSAYRVPTGSMEKTINIGDMLLVNKFVYGFRTPDWIGIPFTEFGFSIPWYKFPQFNKVKRGDIVVFKPPMELNNNYVKRCVALPGDTILFKNKQLYINGELFEKFYSTLEVDSTYKAGYPKSIYRQYNTNYPLEQKKEDLVKSLKQLGLYNPNDSTLYMNPDILKQTFQTQARDGKKFHISYYDYFTGLFDITFSDQKLNSLDKESLQDLVAHGYHVGKPEIVKVTEEDIFSALNFRDNFGPLVVPKNHYFMAGDNRDNSSDSRYWGFVNKNYIIGKPIMVYFSYDSAYPFSKLFEGIRWERIGYFLQ